MATETFSASVKYNDFKGTSAADEADVANARKWLEDRGLMKEGDFLLGIEMSVGENHNKHTDPVYVAFNLVQIAEYENVGAMLNSTNGPVPVRRITQQMTVAEFLGMFKRFNVTLSPDRLLEGREISFKEE